MIDATRVVSAGPFRNSAPVREYPPGALLFEMRQLALDTPEKDVEGWMLEQEWARWLAGKIVRTLAFEFGKKREKMDHVFRRARGRLKRYMRHLEDPFIPSYEGKWISSVDLNRIREFPGVPRNARQNGLVASVECFEAIPCDICEKACPEGAIRFSLNREQIFDETKCTACGRCLRACPSGAITLIQERENLSVSLLVLPWRGKHKWLVGQMATLLNRRGEVLGAARISAVLPLPGQPAMVQVEVPTHLIWEVRGIRWTPTDSAVDENFLDALSETEQPKVEITLNGDKRLVRDNIPITVALFEIGQNRPDDNLFCRDGSCGLCHVVADGMKKLACQTRIHRGMSIRLTKSSESARISSSKGDMPLCSCLGITPEQVVERIRQGKLRSPEAVLSATHVGEGKCHGQICRGAFERLLESELAALGLEPSEWIDWRFPWAEWVMLPGTKDS